MQPQPTEKEIQFILDAIAEYLTVKVSIFSLVAQLCILCKACLGPWDCIIHSMPMRLSGVDMACNMAGRLTLVCI